MSHSTVTWSPTTRLAAKRPLLTAGVTFSIATRPLAAVLEAVSARGGRATVMREVAESSKLRASPGSTTHVVYVGATKPGTTRLGFRTTGVPVPFDTVNRAPPGRVRTKPWTPDAITGAERAGDAKGVRPLTLTIVSATTVETCASATGPKRGSIRRASPDAKPCGAIQLSPSSAATVISLHARRVQASSLRCNDADRGPNGRSTDASTGATLAHISTRSSN